MTCEGACRVDGFITLCCPLCWLSELMMINNPDAQRVACGCKFFAVRGSPEAARGPPLCVPGAHARDSEKPWVPVLTSFSLEF